MYHRQYPHTRLRRFRRTENLRNLVAENILTVQDIIAPLFVTEGLSAKITPVETLPGVSVFDEKSILDEVAELWGYGVRTIALFPRIASEYKTEMAEYAYDDKGLIPRVLRSLKSIYPDLTLIADVALDPYTSHGHDGITDNQGYVLNDETIEILVKQAVVLAQSGADILAPSDMMDGRIREIRKRLDRLSLENVLILSYAVKYASSLYAPFRDAVGSSASLKGDKKAYQMDVSNYSEAYHEVSLDLSEGADCILIKPGLSCLDVLSYVKQMFAVPTFVYQVSGEYAMIQQAILSGTLSDKVILEILLSFKRAGADAILTYFAKTIAQKLKEP